MVPEKKRDHIELGTGKMLAVVRCRNTRKGERRVRKHHKWIWSLQNGPLFSDSKKTVSMKECVNGKGKGDAMAGAMAALPLCQYRSNSFDLRSNSLL